MKNKALQILALAIAASPAAGWAQAPKDGTYISTEDIQAVLKHAADTKRTIPDNSIRIIDMGNYQTRRRRHPPRRAGRDPQPRRQRGRGKPCARLRRAARRCDRSYWNFA